MLQCPTNPPPLNIQKEAVTLIVQIPLVRKTESLGRPDVCLGQDFCEDLEAGDEARELLALLWGGGICVPYPQLPDPRKSDLVLKSVILVHQFLAISKHWDAPRLVCSLNYHVGPRVCYCYPVSHHDSCGDIVLVPEGYHSRTVEWIEHDSNFLCRVRLILKKSATWHARWFHE